MRISDWSSDVCSSDLGRKQYRYHPDFRARQEADKFDRCAGFGCALPKLRARVERDLKQPGIGRQKAIAAVIRLLDASGIRVGNESYTQLKGSFGATTLRTRDRKNGGEGKSGEVRVDLG